MDLVAHFGSHSPVTGNLANVEGMSAGPWYHGTRGELRPGDHIEPGHGRANYGGHRGRRLEHSYFTSSPSEAQAYARNSRADGLQRVYQVEPTGPHEPDTPRGHPDYRSEHPLRVVHEVWHDTSWGDDPNPLAAEHGLGDRHGVLDHFEAASRPGRGQESCSCCAGQGEHGDGSRCERCQGSGFTGKGDRSPACPGQAQPRRKHWRQGAAEPDFRDHRGDPRDDKHSQTTFGGTHCLMCHEPVRINLRKLDTASGGWHHHDSMKRDHPAIPADARAVYDDIPRQKAAYGQAVMDMSRQLESQGWPPRRRGDEHEMPPDPFAHQGSLTRPAREDFIHELPDHEGESTTDRYRIHDGKYLLYEHRPGLITAHRIGKAGLVSPNMPNYSSPHKEPRRVGYLSHFTGEVRRNPDGTPENSNVNGGVIHEVYVSGPHRRKGVASAMLAFARERHPELEVRHSTALSEEGKSWSAATASLLGHFEAGYEEASPQARESREDRVSAWLDRNAQPDGKVMLPRSWGPHIEPHEIPRLEHHGWPADLDQQEDHWGHLAPERVSLRQQIHVHQPFVHADAMHEKQELDRNEHELGRPFDEEPARFLRHEGTTYLIDGHHRYARARLTGKSSMEGVVADTSRESDQPRNCPECREMHADDDEPMSREASGGFNPVTTWGAEKPHAAAIAEAQHRTREDHPMMGMQLPEPEWTGAVPDADVSLRHMLRRAGYPEEKAAGAWVRRKPETATASSTGYDPGDGTVGIGLHPHRWDYGTMAHEAAHLVANHEAGRPPHAMAHALGLGDADVHGPDFARAYGRIIGSSWGEQAGDDFHRHHQDALQLVSNYRSRVHKLPRIDGRDQAPSPVVAHFEADAADQVDLYHHTTPENAAAIRGQRRMIDQHNQQGPVFFSDTAHGFYGGDYGPEAVHVRVPRHLATENDSFGGGKEKFYTVRASDLLPEHFVDSARQAAVVANFEDDDEESEHPWWERRESETGQQMAARRDRYVRQIADRHGVSPEAATGALKKVHDDLHRDLAFTDASRYGLKLDHSQNFFTEHMIGTLNKPETWAGVPVSQVPTEKIHVSQNWLRPRTLSHNLFHPGRHEADSEEDAGHPDRDPDDFRDDEEPREDEHGLGGVTRFVRRRDGRVQVADGHHRVAIDAALGKTYTPGRIIDEDRLHELHRTEPAREPGTAHELWDHLRADHDKTPSELPERSAGSHHDLAAEHGHSHEFEQEYLGHQHTAALASAPVVAHFEAEAAAEQPAWMQRGVELKSEDYDGTTGNNEVHTAAADHVATEPNRAVHAAVERKVSQEHPHLDQAPEDRTGTLRKMLGRASFFMPQEEISSAEAPDHARTVHELAHHAGHVMTDRRQGLEEARPRESWDSHPKPSDLDPDHRRHGHDFTWHYALALDGAGHRDAADTARRHYTSAKVSVANERHGRGLSRDFPGSDLSPDMPPDLSHLPPMIDSQREGLAAGDEDYHRKMLDMASHPEPGLRLWRGERRPPGEDLSRVHSVGMHWSAKPEGVITGPDRGTEESKTRPVVWQSRLEHPEHQAIPRSHPMWRGIHESMPSEAEVRLHPGAAVHVEGAWVGEPGLDSSVHPLNPGRNPPGWKWHPVDRSLQVAHKPGPHGVVDYSDVGIPKEGAVIPGYEPKPEYVPAPEGLDDDANMRHFEQQRNIKGAWTQKIRRGLSLGHLSADRAKELGYYAGGHETDDRGNPKWAPLPREMYHVTTDLPGVQRHGLLTRRELAQHQRGGLGLGGGEDDAISVTTSRETADNLLRSLHDYHHFINHGSPRELWEKARRGEDATRPFHEDLARYWDHDWKDGNELPRGLEQHLEERKIEHVALHRSPEDWAQRHGPGWRPHHSSYPLTGGDGVTRHNVWERDLTPDERREQRSGFYKHFSTTRGWPASLGGPGGREDPLFFANDVKRFAESDPRKFATLHLRARPGAQGYPMGSLAEWRTGSGDALEVHHAEQLHPAREREAYLKPRAAVAPERAAEIQRIREERRSRPARRAGEPGPDLSKFFTPIPAAELEQQRREREEAFRPRPQRLDDREYSTRDVSRHYDWEGFDPHEISHLVHEPQRATFTREEVPVASLRHVGENGQLVHPPSYHDIAGQDEDEHERLRGLEHGYERGDAIPPIVVVRDGEHHVIADGSHRAAVHAEHGQSHIPAFVTKRTIFPESAEHTASRLPAPAAAPRRTLGQLLDTLPRAIASCDPQSPDEARAMLGEVPAMLRTASAALGSLAGRLEDLPVGQDTAETTRRLAGLLGSRAEQAEEILRRTEGTWTPSDQPAALPAGT